MIDVHGHLFQNPEDLDSIVKSNLIEQVWLQDLSFFEDRNVWRDKKSATQAQILQVANNYPGFFMPFGYLDFRKPPEGIKELYDMGFQGLKAIYPLKPYDDLSYFPYYEKAAELKMPILFHTGIVKGYPYADAVEGLSQSSRNMTPSALYNIASSFPDLTVIGAHLGNPWLDEAVMCLRVLPNIYFDTSGGNSVYQKWLIEHLHWAAPVRDGSKGGFIDKILMGIDAYYGLKEIHKDIFNAINQWKYFFQIQAHHYIWGKDVEKIMRINAKGISFPKRKDK